MDEQIDSWNVMVNGVTVGKIESAVLTKIDQDVMRDKRIWLAQGIELGRCVVRGLSCAAQLTPFAAFGFGLFTAASSPMWFNDQVKADAAALFMQTALLGASASLAAVIFGGCFGLIRFGYQNQFSKRKGHLMRLVLGVPADGEISATPIMDTALLRKENEGSHG